jgi:hypothetical protein
MRDEFGAFIRPEVAYAKLGIYGGDDGLSANLTKFASEQASLSVGQKLDLERIYRSDQFGVKFLARHYGPDVWFGSADSMCDIRRQLAKFHLTVHLPSNITREEKLKDKAFAFSLTDTNTPVLGDFVKKALELFPMGPVDNYVSITGHYGIELDTTKQYPNYDGGEWMEHYVATQLTDFDLCSFRAWIESCDCDTIFDPPRFAEPVSTDSKPGVVCVDGDITIVPEPEPEQGRPAGRDKSSPNGKHRFRPRKPKSKRDRSDMGNAQK